MVAKANFTDLGVNRLKLPTVEERQIDYWEKSSPLGLRLSFGGARTWIVQPRVLSEGRWVSKRRKIGRVGEVSLEDARRTAREWVIYAKTGKDPKELAHEDKDALQEASKVTLEICADRFLKEHRKKDGRELSEATKREFGRALKTGSEVKSLQKTPIAQISSQQLRTALNKMQRRGATAMASRTLAYWKSFFKWCVRKQLISANPVELFEQENATVKRDRILTDAEIKEVWFAAEKAGGIFEQFFKLAILTGQRRSEIAGMTWEELTLEGHDPVWEMSAVRTKAKRVHFVPLSPQAKAIIQKVPVRSDTPFLFGGAPRRRTDNSQKVEHHAASGFSKAKKRLDEQIENSRRDSNVREEMPHWTIHDLRRTFRSGLARLGIRPEVARKVVNHQIEGIDAIYDRYTYLPERRDALEQWGAYVERLVKGATVSTRNPSPRLKPI